MSPSGRWFLFACLVAGACAAPSSPAPPPVPRHVETHPLGQKEFVPHESLAAVVEAEWIGHLLYEFDHMADVGTAFLATRVSPAENRALAGSFTMPEPPDSSHPPGSYVSVFVTREAPARVAFRVHMVAAKEPLLEKVSPPVLAEDALLSQLRARRTALAEIPAWNGAMRAIVLPGSVAGRPDSLVVYLIRQERHPRELATGMHYRVFVSADGATPLQVEPLSDIPDFTPVSEPDQADVAVTTLSNYRLGHPSEIDVFMSLAHADMQLAIVSARVYWFVLHGAVGALRYPPEPGVLDAARNALRGRAAQNGMPAQDLPAEYH